MSLDNVALVPGLVNPHTHLDLSGARGLIPPTPPDTFADWLRGVIAYRRTRTPDETRADIRAGLGECLRHGTTLVGDIAAGGASWAALAAADVRAVVFHEFLGLTAERAAAAALTLAEWSRSPAETPTCRKGYSPHAPYTARRSLLSAAGWAAARAGRPLAVHLAESPAEVELVRRRQGPFVEFLTDMGVYDESDLCIGTNDVMMACDSGQPQLYIHGNYLSPATRFPRGATVVYCPRTHAAFGHPPHPFRDFLARGVRVCLGTDSLASNPDLDPLAEARFVRTLHPDVPGDALLRMVTLSGAEALGWADVCGSLKPGASADVVVVPLPDRDAADPHDLLLADDAGDRRTMFRGAWRA